MKRLASTLHGSKAFSSTMLSEPTVLTLKNGTVIPYPRGSEREIKPFQVFEHGQKAVELFLPETNYLDTLCNLAQLQYLEKRNQLLQFLHGKWVAVNSKGSMVVAPSEREVRQIAEFAFPYRVDEYYANCVGCEIMCIAVMDHNDSGHDSEQMPVPENLSSWVFENQFFVKAEHSFSGHEFKSFVIKHDSGATMMGVPKEYLSNPPAGAVLNRGPTISYLVPDGNSFRARTFKDHFIRVAGQTIKVDVIGSRTWLLGFPVISHFRNVLDSKAKEVVG